ncbi:DUF7064 domain-containing protein [Mycobacteroides abscessus]|uniref:DUF7064 domain-containing protein n=1 Tax=Mycobacteroides abscessus TaxID=36809 RepID=UPI000DBB97F2|nr:hypothetical protein MASB_10160 [Mycobacteroides abscessus subsp. bolletii BD]
MARHQPPVGRRQYKAAAGHHKIPYTPQKTHTTTLFVAEHATTGQGGQEASVDQGPRCNTLARREIHYATDVNAVTYLAPDGLTHRGGEITWSMPDGEVLTLRADVMEAVVGHLHNVYYVDPICDQSC